MNETKLVREIQGKLSKDEVRLFRNNCGKLQDKNGTWVAYGLCPGSSDLIGWREVLITSEMVGKTVAQFVALEVKSNSGRPTPEQIAFLLTVMKSGGLSSLVFSLEEARQVLNIPDDKATVP